MSKKTSNKRAAEGPEELNHSTLVEGLSRAVKRIAALEERVRVLEGRGPGEQFDVRAMEALRTQVTTATQKIGSIFDEVRSSVTAAQEYTSAVDEMRSVVTEMTEHNRWLMKAVSELTGKMHRPLPETPTFKS